MPETTLRRDDQRFTLGLALAAARVIEDHGYPDIDGRELVELQAALFGYLYRAGGLGRRDGAR